MTPGQQRALRDLQRLCAVTPDNIEIVGAPEERHRSVRLVVSIRIGAIEAKAGGLKLHEREEFILWIPADFPFDYPRLTVAHDRFAGFPHVIWSRGICLYRQATDWNPRAGLCGFFEKLHLWLAKAAINDMDPADLPLEPPHHVTSFSQVPFVVGADAPSVPGDAWIGFAQLERLPNRTELVGWTALGEEWPTGKTPALAIMLPKPLPMEFPRNGDDFFRELAKQDVDRNMVLRQLAVAAMLSALDAPLHLVLGLPMRRSADGEPRIHVAVWTVSAGLAKSLRLTVEKEDDSPLIKELREDLAGTIYDILKDGEIVFCRILDNRPEIIVPRDHGSAASWFANKRVLLLGCGALGSWVGEIVARAGAAAIHAVDNGIVKPGVLARQNFRLADIAANKASALIDRLRQISSKVELDATDADAHAFIMEDSARFCNFDVAIDCTASSIFQMKLERDWKAIGGSTPAMVSIGIDSEAKRCIAVTIPCGSVAGVWDAYVQLQYRLCATETNRTILDAFYTERASDKLFQPEPGCSEPTFVGSTADVVTLASSALNLAAAQLGSESPCGIAFSAPDRKTDRLQVDVIHLSVLREVSAGHYRVRTADNVFRESRAWVQQSNRHHTTQHETGGLLWGLWDDAVGVIWVFDASGPPPDSKSEPGRFVCGVAGTAEEHSRRMKRSRSGCGFIGMWHTHPEMAAHQSGVDVGGMTTLVSSLGQNQRRALMLIFGSAVNGSRAGFYVYESHGHEEATTDLVSVASAETNFDIQVV